MTQTKSNFLSLILQNMKTTYSTYSTYSTRLNDNDFSRVGINK